ncbi:transposase [Jeotgalibacillus soli]|uniref:Transposase n=1 Tax=Jeotgalibacillus soli TaxID=889306 RepID=A0A0C2V0H8_9BACL|nr:transposase [Jeotgalibacillus soli]
MKMAGMKHLEITAQKTCLSAILGLYDGSIVSVLGNNQLVFDTLDEALAISPEAHLLLHNDRGF